MLLLKMSLVSYGSSRYICSIKFNYAHYSLLTCIWQLLAEYEKEPHKPKLKKEGSLMHLHNNLVKIKWLQQ